jgi:hypothetical protein
MMDPTKIFFTLESVKGDGTLVSGHAIRDFMKWDDRYYIDPEAFYGKSVLLATHIGTTTDTKNKLVAAVKELNDMAVDPEPITTEDDPNAPVNPTHKEKKQQRHHLSFKKLRERLLPHGRGFKPGREADGLPELEYVYTLDEVFAKPTKEMKLSDPNVVGHVSACLRGPVPPGAIIMDFGARITRPMLDFFEDLDKQTVTVVDESISAVKRHRKKNKFHNKHFHLKKEKNQNREYDDPYFMRDDIVATLGYGGIWRGRGLFEYTKHCVDATTSVPDGFVEMDFPSDLFEKRVEDPLDTAFLYSIEDLLITPQMYGGNTLHLNQVTGYGFYKRVFQAVTNS